MSDAQTAVEALRAQDKERRDRHMFELRVQDFVKTWAPDDPYERAQFDAQLFSLVRQIYFDAQQTVWDELTKIAMGAMPAPFVIPKDSR